MKKHIKLLKIFILILFFVVPTSIFADVTCSTLNETVDSYNDIVKELEGLDCDDTTSNFVVMQCNNLRTQKSLTLSKLFKYNDYKLDCNNPELKKIIDDNSDKCKNVFGSTLKDYTKTVMGIFYIIAPFLLIIFGSIDFSKIVTMNDPKMITKARSNFFKRLAAFVLLYMVPLIVNLILNFNFSSYSLTGNVYSCKTEVGYQMDRWEITYVPPANERKRGGVTGDGNIVYGGITTDEEAAELDAELTAMLNTQHHGSSSGTGGMYQGGPYPKWWTSPYNLLSPFQCTWWANGRASQYLEQYGTKYTKYPTQMGDGGDYYKVNVNGGWFRYGSSPKPNSIISWTQGGKWGHVAYVEGVSSDGIYISHAGSGLSWLGIQKIPLDGSIWPGAGYDLNGYVYLDEPIE